MKICAALALVLLTGCASGGRIVTKIPVPVECREEVPDRPQMPTEQLPQGASLDAFVQAATAEIERREGYEVRLRAALEACTRQVIQ